MVCGLWPHGLNLWFTSRCDRHLACLIPSYMYESRHLLPDGNLLNLVACTWLCLVFTSKVYIVVPQLVHLAMFPSVFTHITQLYRSLPSEVLESPPNPILSYETSHHTREVWVPNVVCRPHCAALTRQTTVQLASVRISTHHDPRFLSSGATDPADTIGAVFQGSRWTQDLECPCHSRGQPPLPVHVEALQIGPDSRIRQVPFFGNHFINMSLP
jgi:hypothetical protein